MGMLSLLRRLRADRAGSVVIETAFVVPILAVLGVGGYEISRVVAKQNEMQVAIAEAGAIVLAKTPEDDAERNAIKAVIVASTGLPEANVSLLVKYRCNADTTLVTDYASCATTATISEYIEITMNTSYTPIWTGFGMTGSVPIMVKRRVQVA